MTRTALNHEILRLIVFVHLAKRGVAEVIIHHLRMQNVCRSTHWTCAYSRGKLQSRVCIVEQTRQFPNLILPHIILWVYM